MTDDDMREMLAAHGIRIMNVSTAWPGQRGVATIYPGAEILSAMAAVRAATIEECARVAESLVDHVYDVDAGYFVRDTTARYFATAIRALSKGQGE